MMKKSVFAAVLAVLALGTANVGNGAAGKVRLRLRLQKGRTYGLKFTANQDITQTIQGKQQALAQTIGMGILFDVLDVAPDGAMSAKISYDWVLIRQKGAMGTIEYDSARPPKVVHPMAKGFAALLGQSLWMKMAPDGRVADVKGVDALITRMMSKLGLPEGPQKAMLEKQLRKQFGNEAVKGMVGDMTSTFPDRAVAIGESWSETKGKLGMFPVMAKNTWTLKSRKGGVASVAVRSEIKPHPTAPTIEMGPLKMTYKLSGSQKGEMQVDEATGWTIRGNITQNISGQLKVQAPGQTPGGMTIPMTIRSVITMEQYKPKSPTRTP